jgi:hypothetical protein
VLTTSADREAVYHKALIKTIIVGSLTAHKIGNPAAQIMRNITGAKGKLTKAINWIRGRYLFGSYERYRATSP